MNKKAATTLILSLFTALGVALSGVSVADIVTIASGADYYSHPKVNNLDEIVWSQTGEGRSTIWSDKRGQVSFGVYHGRETYPDINDMGEIIWRFGDGGQGADGIESNIRGLIYYEQGGALDPYYDSNRINNNGEIIWTKSLWPSYRAEEIWSNDRGRLTYSQQYAINRQPEINDNGEVIYRSNSRGPTGNIDIISTERGAITNDDLYQEDPDVNNIGEVVWTKHVPDTDYTEIWSNIRGRISTINDTLNFYPSINDSGEIVWQFYDGDFYLEDGDFEIFSNVQGQITSNEVDDERPIINNRGTIVWTSNNRKSVVALYPVSELAVTIDIKPGNDSNSINASSSGVIPVAILSSVDFDAATVNPKTVSLAGASVKLAGKSDKYLCHQEDVNLDGLIDMVCKVYTVQLMVEEGETIAILEAETLDGTKLRGEDFIRIVPDI